MTAALLPIILLVQGGYYALTGIWSLVDIDSFQKVTGPKRDLWLVKTVGAVVLVIGAVLLVAGWRGNASLEVLVLAIGSALALTAIDAWYSARRVISPVYLVDAVAELTLIGAIIFAVVMRG
jgi:hypothetical protein